MRSKNVFALVMLILLFAVDIAVGEVSVGVKKGYWIEYEVSTTGTTEEGHDVTWARMEILAVQGNEITVDVITKAVNGTFSSGVMTMNPAEGNVGI